MPKKIQFMLDGGRDVLELEVKEDTNIANVRKALKAECAPELDQFAAVKLKLYLTTDGNVAPSQLEMNPSDLHSVITDTSIVVIHHPPYKTEAPRSFWIRHWVGQDVSCKQFSAPTNYDAFRKLLMRAFNFPFAAKVYYFPGDNPANIAHRVLVNAEAFQTFLSMPQEDQPLLYMWKRDQTDSPDFGPADQEESKSEVAEDASDTSRGSVQTVWSTGVKNLDGWKCVVCANNNPLIGAHVIPRTATPEELRAARLPTAYEARNGVTMCANCSGLYDSGYFFFEKDGTLHISAALTTSKPEWAAREGAKINRTVERTEENWPTDPIIEAPKAYNLVLQKRRHEGDDLPFHCAKCGKAYKQAKRCSNHEKGCVRTHLKTPAKAEGKKS